MAATPSQRRPWSMVTGFDWVGSMRPLRNPSGGADGVGARRQKRDGSSPFEAALGERRRTLARPLDMQFFGADWCHQVRMDGAMHRVWHRHTWLRPFFGLLARVVILFPESGCDVPASMTIARVDQGTVWRRTFSFAKIRRFNATMTYQPQLGVVERIGPGGVIEVPWRVRPLGRDTFEITTGRLRMRAGPLRLPI